MHTVIVAAIVLIAHYGGIIESIGGAVLGVDKLITAAIDIRQLLPKGTANELHANRRVLLETRIANKRDGAKERHVRATVIDTRHSIGARPGHQKTLASTQR
jgi:hypothetical protein